MVIKTKNKNKNENKETRGGMRMFLIFNKEKIQTYLVSILTVAVLIGIANIEKIRTVETSTNSKSLPIYNVKTDENEIALTMNCAW